MFFVGLSPTKKRQDFPLSFKKESGAKKIKTSGQRPLGPTFFFPMAARPLEYWFSLGAFFFPKESAIF
jgi:hypothetical protein